MNLMTEGLPISMPKMSGNGEDACQAKRPKIKCQKVKLICLNFKSNAKMSCHAIFSDENRGDVKERGENEWTFG